MAHMAQKPSPCGPHGLPIQSAKFHTGCKNAHDLLNAPQPNESSFTTQIKTSLNSRLSSRVYKRAVGRKDKGKSHLLEDYTIKLSFNKDIQIDLMN
ncbi:hypothetical protein GOBAR_AA39710 [Gossypium barbadense]|uniref:Uncharacterized protein n=1 Tax=Gossypium barbadense TaxID=3634 RepID=A0A2P5VQA5_GOSBA|nr:hypothetical protein GOBAR_AA39710 [Gossypium barbadense]